MKTDTASSGQFGNQNYQNGNRTDGYTELSREVAPPPKKQQWLEYYLSTICDNLGYFGGR